MTDLYDLRKSDSYARLTVGNLFQTSTLTRFLLTYRQLIFVMVYSHLLRASLIRSLSQG